MEIPPDPYLFGDLVSSIKGFEPLVWLGVILVELLCNIRTDVAKLLLWRVQ